MCFYLMINDCNLYSQPTVCTGEKETCINGYQLSHTLHVSYLHMEDHVAHTHTLHIGTFNNNHFPRQYVLWKTLHLSGKLNINNSL